MIPLPFHIRFPIDTLSHLLPWCPKNQKPTLKYSWSLFFPSLFFHNLFCFDCEITTKCQLTWSNIYFWGMIGRSILITGCNRGLGLEFVKQLTRPGARSPSGAPLIATCRDPSSAHELQKLRSEDANLHILKLDTTDFAGLKAFAEDVKTLTDPSSGLGLLINNAGIGSGLTRFHTVTQELMEDVYRTNAVAPMMLTQALAEQLKMFGAHSEENSGEKALIVNMSSILGSLANNPYATGKGND